MNIRRLASTLSALAMLGGLVLVPSALQAADATTATAPRVAHTPRVATEKSGVDCRKVRCVALTYDDGPSTHTPRLLRTLHRTHAHATFFVLGQEVEKRPELLRQVARGGHEVGVHTWAHQNLTRVSSSAALADLRRTKAIIARHTGRPVTLSRPPYGATNPAVRAAEHRAGLTEVLWTVDTNDWRDRNAGLVTRRVLSSVRANSVVLMHDIHPTTVDAAPAIIAGLKRRGYHLVTVSQLPAYRR